MTVKTNMRNRVKDFVLSSWAEPDLERFIVESNRIEGITSFSMESQIQVYRDFLLKEKITIPDLEEFVMSVQSGARLRSLDGLNVRVGKHVPPQGGPQILMLLRTLLDEMKYLTPFEVHVRYEGLHPFTDGNGRSGRVLWLWQMLRSDMVDALGAYQLGFLHLFYYQTLDKVRR